MLFFTARYDLTPHIEAGKKARTEGWKQAVRSVFGSHGQGKNTPRKRDSFSQG